MRTTVAIDDLLLNEIKAIQAREGKTQEELINELLTLALAIRLSGAWQPPRFEWESANMGMSLVELADKEALWAVLDERHGP
ncbi:MAG: hypothetical protein SF066_10010 [Thermoanaerobaculia bacterium]|nr:hypothetical protein [Thermoanaerobaculia bacterium]